MKNWIEIFRVGRHTDAAGNTREWTEGDLQKIVDKYNPEEHEAPVVIGHPKDNAPAFAWVEGLKLQGGKLYMKMKQVAGEFADMLKEGRFKKRSIALYPDMTLRHVGFLGATPPAVKGLKDIDFTDDGDPILYEFAEQGNTPGQGHGQKKTQQSAETGGQQAGSGAQNGSPGTAAEGDFSELRTLLASLKNSGASKEQIATVVQRLDALEKKQRQNEFAAIVDKHISAGRLLPKHREQVLAFMEALHGQGQHEFSDGARDILDAFNAFLETLPRALQYGALRVTKKEKNPRSRTQRVAQALRE